MRERINERDRQQQQQQQQQQQAAAAASVNRITHPVPPEAAAVAAATATGGASVSAPATPAALSSQPTVLQKKPQAVSVTTASILQQQLSAPLPAAQTAVAVNSAAGSSNSNPPRPQSGPPSAVSIQQQLPLHPLPQTPQQPPTAAAVAAATAAAAAAKNAPGGNILQSQLTIQTANLQLPNKPHPQMTPTQPSPVLTPSPVTPQQQQQQPQAVGLPEASAPAPAGQPDQQEKAISEIMQSLMKDSAQFEADKTKASPQQSPVAAPSTTPTLVGGAQLPTRPVPPASLGNHVVNNVVKQQPQQPQAANSKLVSNRVTLQNLLSAQAQQQAASGSPAKTVSVAAMPQLAAQLSRPPTSVVSVASSLPPSYTQAVAQAQQAAAVAQSPRPRLILTSAQNTQLARRTSSGSIESAANSGNKSTIGQDNPGLQALLANAPSADNPEAGNPNATVPSIAGSSLLKQLVSGSHQNSAALQASLSASGNASTTNTVRSLPSQSPGHSGTGSNNSNAADSTQEITLAAILAKPVAVSPASAASNASRPTTPMSNSSPTKASPLLQQLQQPPHQRQQQILQQMSPKQAQQPVQSPRMIQPAPSPRPQYARVSQAGGSTPTSLQQHLMQPPVQVARTQQSILSATLQQAPQPMVSVSQVLTVPVQDHQHSNGIQVQAGQSISGQNVLSLQNLLQSGMVQVSTASSQPSGMQQPQIHHQQANNPSGGSMVQLQIPGLQQPVTLSVNQQQLQQQMQQQPKPQTIVTSMGKIIQAASSGTTGSQTVVLQQTAGNNYIHLPQQPTKTIQVPQSAAAVAAAATNNILKTTGGTQLLQVRPGPGGQGGGQLFLQMPPQPGGAQVSAAQAGQSIQIVRTMPSQQPQPPVPSPGNNGQQQQQAPQQQQQQIVQLKSPPGLAPTPSPQTPNPSPSGSMTSPQSGAMVPPDSPLLAAIQQPQTDHQQQQAGQLILGHTGNKQAQLGLNHAQLKMRQQRKQSLK